MAAQSQSPATFLLQADIIGAAARTRRIEESKSRCESLVGFVREAWPILEPSTSYVHGWHIDAIAEHLEAITWGRLLSLGLQNRLLVNVPPGTMKSLLISVIWPAWEWGPAGKPELRYFTTSYSDKYATRDCRKMRDLVDSEWYRERWPVRLNRKGETSIANTAGGGRDAMPFCSLTAGRGDRVIFDDPHSTEMAESEADRERTTRIFRESVTLRLNNPAESAIVGIMQRLHEKDISGVIIASAMPYVHIMLPMEYESDRACTTALGFRDPRTEDGELLFAERFTPATVARDKVILGDYAVAGQFQQRPAPRGGGMFKRYWFDVLPAAPAGIRWVRSWDLAGSTTKKSPYTAGLKMGVHRGTYYVGHVIRERELPEKVVDLIVATAKQDGKECTVDIPQDPGQAGKHQARYIAQQLAGFVVHFSPETGSKADRAGPVAAQAAAGNVKLVDGPWIAAFLEELEVFPNGAYLDQGDALSRAFARLLLPTFDGGNGLAAPFVVTVGQGED